MTSLSGLACILGASVICIDIIIRQFPGKRDFRIQDSDTFLSMSLSLSFGVMLFSALYSMLPSAKKSLQEGGYSPKAASWILIICFIGGVVGIQLISRVLHQYTCHLTLLTASTTMRKKVRRKTPRPTVILPRWRTGLKDRERTLYQATHLLGQRPSRQSLSINHTLVLMLVIPTDLRQSPTPTTSNFLKHLPSLFADLLCNND
jgi:zinc transporter ZupT